MFPAQWERLQEIFLATVELAPAERQHAIAAATEGDADLAESVWKLLAADEGDSILDHELHDVAEAALRDDPVHALVQQQIGPYRLLRLLGEGGMGVVYLAERTDIGGAVAIKMLRHSWMSPMRRQRFLQEQHTLARLNHPHIARIYDAGTLEDGTPWFVMEYADGAPLTAWARTRGGSLEDDLQLFRQVCEAVRFAHRHAVVHRDLKPSNILVTASGEVKLLDFGIAKDLEDAAGAGEGRTVEGLRLFTPGYAAPEQIAGGAIGLFTDVYTLGVLLHELLTGRSLHASTEAGTATPLPKPSAVSRAHPETARFAPSAAQWEDLDTLCLAALRTDPEERYASVDALLGDLDAFLESRPLTARPPAFLYLAGKFFERHRAMLIAVGAAAILLVLSTVVFTIRIAHARDAALRELGRRNRIQRFTESLFDGGDPGAGPARDLTTASLLKRGETEAEGLHDDPQLQSDMFSTLGEVYQRLGQLDHADRLLNRSLEERRQHFGEGAKEYAESLVSLGLLRRDQGRHKEAETTLREALALQRSTLSPADPALEHTTWALASVLALRGQYPESGQLLEAALARPPQPGEATMGRADTLAQLADVHFYLGEYPRSEALYKEALATYRRLGGNNHPRVGEMLNDLGQIAWNRGHTAEAEGYLRQSLAIDEAWYGPEHPNVAADLTSIGKVLVTAGQYDQAHSLFHRALAIQESTYGHNHSRVALVLNELGSLAYTRDRDDEAERDFSEALKIWRGTYGDHHQFVGLCYANLTGIFMHRKDYATAEATAHKALATYAVTLPPEHVSNAIMHVKLGRILLREGRFAEAEAESLKGYVYFRAHETGYPSYLAGARKDLLEIEASRHRPEIVAQLNAGPPHP